MFDHFVDLARKGLSILKQLLDNAGTLERNGLNIYVNTVKIKKCLYPNTHTHTHTTKHCMNSVNVLDEDNKDNIEGNVKGRLSGRV